MRSILLLLLLSTPSLACEHLKYGQPKQSDFVECRGGYAIGYNFKLKAADWVAYKLVEQTWEGVDRQDDFREDESIPTQYRTTTEDYEEPVYHMGHLANSESIDRTEVENSETFLMSNMTPQLPGHNTAIWKGLENRERKWADKRGEIYIVTGGIYSDNPKTIGENKVPVPTSYYKVFYDPAKQEMLGFLIPHKKLKTSELNNYFSSIDKIEDLTGLNLYKFIADPVEDELESNQAIKQWSTKH